MARRGGRVKDTFWLEEIIEQATKAIDFSGRSDEASFLAMLKCTENVYEASTALSDIARDALFPDDEHDALRGARNFYVHQYHRVDEAAARRTVTRYFPALVERAKAQLD